MVLAWLCTGPPLPQVWLGVLLTMVGTSVLLNLVTRASPHYELQPARARRRGLFRLTNCLWYMYGATINQGETPRRVAVMKGGGVFTRWHSVILYSLLKVSLIS